MQAKVEGSAGVVILPAVEERAAGSRVAVTSAETLVAARGGMAVAKAGLQLEAGNASSSSGR